MRNKIILIFLLSIVSLGYSQTISPERKQSWINMIDNTDSWIMLEAIDSIRQYNVIEALSKLESVIWSRDYIDQGIIIETIGRLKSPNTSIIARKILDTLRINPQKYLIRNEYSVLDSTTLKLHITEALFHVNDFSTADFIFETIDSSANYKNIPLLETILKNSNQVPTLAQRAKTTLLSIATNKIKYDINIRIDALYVLARYFLPEMLELIKTYCLTEEEDWPKYTALDLLIDHGYPSLVSFLKETNFSHNDPHVRSYYYYIILNHFYTPQNVKWLRDCIQLETDSANKLSIKIDLDYLSPIIKDTTTRIETRIDSLISYTTSCNTLTWLRDETFKTQLNQLLNEGKNFILNRDSLKCAIQVASFMSEITKANSDSTSNYPKYVNQDSYRLLKYYAQDILDLLPAPLIVQLKNSVNTIMLGGSLQFYEAQWQNTFNKLDGTFLIYTKLKNISLRMTYAFGSQTKSNVTVGSDTVVFQTVNAHVKLQNSFGAAIDTGKVQYYAGAWREFGSTANGIASKELLPGNYSFRTTYAYASLDKAQDISTNNFVVFQTVPATVQLKNSLGKLIDVGTVQYYSGAWRDFGVTTNGVAVKELLPNNYSFRMNYAFASVDKQQNIGTDQTVVFQTVPATVQLKNSLGNLIDVGTVQYYSGAWRDFGTTTNGVAVKELLPNNYSFRMNYAFASLDKQQNIGTDPIVVFQTVPATVQLKNGLGNLIDAGTVQYYSGAWRDFGTTTNGVVTKELLPNNYSFRMTYAFVSNDKTQNVGINTTVVFSTVLCTVQVKNTQSQPVNNAMVSYYSGAWRQIGLTINGAITKELLPANLSFRAVLGTTQKDKTQNIATNNIVEIGL